MAPLQTGLRARFDDDAWALTIFERLRPFCPPVHKRRRLVGVTPTFRFVKYPEGASVAPHPDYVAVKDLAAIGHQGGIQGWYKIVPGSSDTFFPGMAADILYVEKRLDAMEQRSVRTSIGLATLPSLLPGVVPTPGFEPQPLRGWAAAT